MSRIFHRTGLVTWLNNALPDVPLLKAIPISIFYYARFKRFPNLVAPARFTDKVQLAKLTWRHPAMTAMADKVRSKEIVERELGPEWVTPNLYVGDSLPPVDQRDWPVPYVIKANQQSGGNYFVLSEADKDWPLIERKLSQWLSRPHGMNKQWAYQNIVPKVLVEPLIAPSETLVDYKCWVFNGRVEFIQTHSDRFTAHKIVFHDRSWRPMDFVTNWPRDPRPQPRPSSLEEMIEGVEKLAKGIPFVRIDLYEIEGRPRFGEFTFYPDSGFLFFKPEKYDFVFGRLWPRGKPNPGVWSLESAPEP